MENLDRVIEELERALRVWLYEQTDRNLMLVQPDVVEDAIAILKALADARQARVIKKEELGKLPSGCVVWHEEGEETGPTPVTPVCFDGTKEKRFGNEPELVIIYSDGFDLVREYGIGYRLWTARPTDEQRRGEKWEEQTI